MRARTEKQTAILEKWLPKYRARSRELNRAVSALMREAIEKQDSEQLFAEQTWSEPTLDHIRRRRAEFPPITLFLYSGSFDPELLPAPEDGVPGLETEDAVRAWAERFSEKAVRVEDAMIKFTMAADVLAEHYTVSLMDPAETNALPLVWKVPDDKHEGLDEDAWWWMSFVLLCELSQAICAYAGASERLAREIEYVERRPHLKRKLFHLDSDLNTYFLADSGEQEETLPITELATFMERVAART